MMLEKRGDRYEGTTYAAMRVLVHRFAAGLMSLGLEKGDRVALISEGRNAWVMAELGILYCGAINVPVSVKIDELDDLKFRLLHAGCTMAIVSQGQVAKIRAIKQRPPGPEADHRARPRSRRSTRTRVSAADVLRLGDALLRDGRGTFDARWQSIAERDYANICYTSGTTADPKGIVLTHRNYTANIEQGVAMIKPRPGWVLLNILPWDHAFGHTCGIYMMMMSGATLASVQAGRTPMDTLKNIPVNIRETRPTLLLSVPALAKNFRKNIEKGVRDKGARAEALFARALKTAGEYNADGWNRGTGRRILKRPLLALYDALIFRKIRANFGGRLQFIIGGGALLDIELQRFFYAIGMPMLQGYGLTEAAPVISANTRARHKLGSSGRIVPGLEVRICGPDGQALPPGVRGEIVVRGENVMAGYWKNEKATAEVLRGGWLYTGDLGYMDTDGFLYVLGRVKSLLIADDGEKYSPEQIEEAITGASPYIEQIMLYNNQSPVHDGAAGAVEGGRAGLADVAGSVGRDAGGPGVGAAPARVGTGAPPRGRRSRRRIPRTLAALGRGGARRRVYRAEPHAQFDDEDGAREDRRVLPHPPRRPVHGRGPIDPQRPEPRDRGAAGVEVARSSSQKPEEGRVAV